MIDHELQGHLKGLTDWELQQKIEEWGSNVNTSVSQLGKECSQEILDTLKDTLKRREDGRNV